MGLNLYQPHFYFKNRQEIGNIRINTVFISNIVKEKLQQTKESYVTTYRELYKVIEERHLKQSVFFYAVKQYTISFLLDYLKTY